MAGQHSFVLHFVLLGERCSHESNKATTFKTAANLHSEGHHGHEVEHVEIVAGASAPAAAAASGARATWNFKTFFEKLKIIAHG